nr:MAG TPA: type I neck protein [Caudoviricetes sp.]
MLYVTSNGDFSKTQKFLAKLARPNIIERLKAYGSMGVDALSAATPKDSGKTAGSWGYEVKQSGKTYSIVWTNTNVVQGVPIAVILQYGHGTGTGGYVKGRDYINPAIQPIMDRIAEDVWKVVSSVE